MRTRILILCTLLCGQASIATRAARAQHAGVPGPSNQNQPYVPPPIRLAPSNGDGGRQHDSTAAEMEQPPAQPQPAPPPPPMNVAPMTAQAAPALPAVFRGCWQGQVVQLDWIRSEPGAHKIGFWTPKKYRLCYRRVGNQPFKLTFTEAGIEPNEKIINPTARWCRSRPTAALTPR